MVVRNMRARLAAAMCAGALAVGPAAAIAQDLPAGISAEDVQAAISAPISVPAGQTTTVSLPVPVSAQYSGGGWSVSSAGQSVTITAPAEGGQVSVPVTAAGRSATITLVADASVDAPTPNTGGGAAGGEAGGEVGGAGGSADAGGGAEGQGGGEVSGQGGGVAGDPGAGGQEAGGQESSGGQEAGGQDGQESSGGQIDRSGAEFIDIESSIEGNVITAKLGVRQALDLYNRFKNLDEQGHTLRYVDAEGNIIEGVQRDINAAARTLTLTYPEGQQPDNPFIMELVRNEDNSAVAVVTLTDPNQASAAGPANSPDPGAQPRNSEAGPEGSGLSPAMVAIVGVLGLVVLGLIVLVVMKAARRGR